MIEAVVVICAAVSALAWVLAPLAGRTRSDPRRPSDDRAQEASSRKRAALDAIVDLEDERAAGKLSERDFEALRTEHEAEALVALRELDALGRARSDGLEKEIAAVRRSLACPTCGRPRPQGRACPQCRD